MEREVIEALNFEEARKLRAEKPTAVIRWKDGSRLVIWPPGKEPLTGPLPSRYMEKASV